MTGTQNNTLFNTAAGKFLFILVALILTSLFTVQVASAETFFSDKTPEALKHRYNSKAFQLVKEGKHNQALFLLEEARKKYPGDATIYANMGNIYLAKNEPQKAWQYFSRAVKLNKNNGLFWLGLARAYGESGDKKTAVKIALEQRMRHGSNSKVVKEATRIFGKYGMSTTGSFKPTEYSYWHNKAIALRKEEKYKEAADLLGRVKTKFDSNVRFHRLYGNCLYKSGNYREAASEYLKASTMEPKDEKPLLMAMACQSAGGDLDGLQASRKDFVKRFPKSKNAKRVGESIKYYEKDFPRARARENGNMASSMVRPYRRGDMPLKVYVHDRLKGRTVWTAGAKKSNEINYSLLIERAMQEWSNASGKRISFIFTDNSDYANIECLWTTNRKDLHMSFAAGVTSYKKNINNRPKATIKLLAKTPKNGLTANEFYSVCLHELGHALGLSHSTNTRDIMYFSLTPEANKQKSVPSLSKEDIDRILRLYKSL